MFTYSDVLAVLMTGVDDSLAQAWLDALDAEVLAFVSVL